jgi:coenzyme F420-0:L-glutamate ligase/coenzyme F420-1:gamma-L-glutamate ligase|tara:strand:- start:1322 stop:2083 length:762 start_codon:yes stop_codon:yes gene_type:complete
MPKKHDQIIIRSLPNIPEVTSFSNISILISNSLDKNNIKLKNKDVLVITQKIISKAENRLIHKNSIIPSNRAIKLSKQIHKNAKLTQLILDESKRIIKKKHGVVITETHHGFICANSGIDQSNVPINYFCLLPINPDNSAKKIRLFLEKKYKIKISVIISDTFGRPFRTGQIDVAIGVSGLSPLLNYKGKNDNYGRKINVTSIAIADELASAAELLLCKTSNTPVALIRGYNYNVSKKTSKSLIMPKNRSLFS